MKRTRNVRRYKRRTRRGGINFQKWAYFTGYPFMKAYNTGREVWNDYARSYQFSVGKRKKTDASQTSVAATATEVKKKVIVFKDNTPPSYLGALNKYDIVQIPVASIENPTISIDTTSPALVIYDNKSKKLPPYDGCFIDINWSTTMHFKSKMFPCYIFTGVNAEANAPVFIRTLDSISNHPKGFLFILSEDNLRHVLSTICDVCLNKMDTEQIKLLLETKKTIAYFKDLKVFTINPVVPVVWNSI